MIKTIFIYWAQQFINAPIIVQKCLYTWKLHNPDWNIIELDNTNLHEYINIEDEIPDIKNKNITPTSLSDIIRIFLLYKYGGCWCDATLFCMKPLNIWLENYITNGFFAFYQNKDRPISSWFLYSEKDNYIITKWKKSVIEYIHNISQLGSQNPIPSLQIWKNNKYNYQHYFWFHYLFVDLLINDYKFKNIWNSCSKYNANIPHFIQHKGFNKLICDEVIKHITEKQSPMYKLSWKYINNNNINNDNNEIIIY